MNSIVIWCVGRAKIISSLAKRASIVVLKFRCYWLVSIGEPRKARNSACRSRFLTAFSFECRDPT